MFTHSIDMPYGRYHDAWRSVRMFEKDISYDARIDCTFMELTKEDQALCVLTGMKIEDTLTDHVLAGGALDRVFVRKLMEKVYDTYNRYTLATRGLKKYGIDWFGIQSDEGPKAVTLVPPYDSLPFATKEIDRRLIMVGTIGLQAELCTSPGVQQAQEDGNAIQEAVRTKTPYNYLSGYVIEASYN